MWMNTQIIAFDTASNVYYTPWFPRGADNAVFALELIKNTLASFAVNVRTKNREDEGSAPGSSAGTFTQLSGNFLQVNCTGLKELVRFEITTRGGAAGDGVIYRFLPPTWYDTAV